jgi:hypothetical protein
LKLLYGLPQPARKLRQFFRAEQQQNDQQNDNQLLGADIHESEKSHSCANIRRLAKSAKLFATMAILGSLVKSDLPA